MTRGLLLTFFLALQSTVTLAAVPASAVGIGLYQSAPEPIPKDITPAPGMKNVEFRTFLQIFLEKRCVLVKSFSPASELLEQDKLRSVYTDGGTKYEAIENGIVFWHGPTKHTVSVIDEATIDLQSQYANGYVHMRRLFLVPQPE